MGCDGNQKDKKDDGIKIKATAKEQKKALEAKIVLLGDQNVGKSSIAQRFCKNIFTNQHIATIGGAYLQQKVLLSNSESVKLHIWDTGGQERFRAMANLYYRDAAAAILTYDITSEETLENLKFWINELRTKAGQENIVLCLAGNKCDVPQEQRKIPFNKAKAFATENNMIFYETSARDDIGIKELFNALAKKIYEIKATESG
ncbi:MAG: GTP-binding protein [archaeon]|nr:GTP-binding protein [archaeon]